MQAINASKGEVWNARRLAEAACQHSENYDQNTLKAGLNILGFYVEADKGRAVTDSSRTYGFLINTARAGFHWVSLRKVNEGYRYFDSMEATHGTSNPTGELFASLKAFKDEHPSYPVFLEVIKPEPRICIEPLTDYGRLQVVDCPFKVGQIIHSEGTNYTVLNRHMNGTECDYLDVVRSDIYDPGLNSKIQSSIGEVRMFLDGTLLKMLIRDGNIVGFISRDVILREMKASIDEKVKSAFKTKNKSAASRKSYTNIFELQGELNAVIREEGAAAAANAAAANAAAANAAPANAAPANAANAASENNNLDIAIALSLNKSPLEYAKAQAAAARERNAAAVAAAASHPWEEWGMTEEEYIAQMEAATAAAEAKSIELRRQLNEIRAARERNAAAAAAANAANAASMAKARQRNAQAVAMVGTETEKLRRRRIENGKTPVEPPWKMMISKTKGIPYYVHLTTEEKRWNHPVLRPDLDKKGGRRSTHRRKNKNMRNRTRGHK